jgi:choline kinase
MKAIILAAGQGTRLRPLTDNQPKCMVPFKGRPIIDYIISSLKEAGIDNIVVVGGYREDVLKKHLSGQHIKFYTNEKYSITNMVSTLFCAESEMDDDIIVSYADIIYSVDIISKLIAENSDFSVIVDRDWKALWSLRMENPLRDAETMKIDKENFIYELGKKPTSYDEVQGQYIGLIKFRREFVKTTIAYYHNLDKSLLFDGRDYDNMYMTSLIQSLIDNVKKPRAVFIDGGWIEVDSVGDLNIYEKLNII